jgi:uncharacterized repeat protein (TIGR01451 family)
MQKPHVVCALLLLAFLPLGQLQAQFHSEFFFDSVPASSKLWRVVRDKEAIYTIGTAQTGFGFTPVLNKLDTFGNILWNLSYFGFSADDYTPIGLLPAGDDMFLLSTGSAGNPTTLGSFQLSRIDLVQGNVVYNQVLGDEIGSSHLLEYDSDRLLAYYGDDFDGIQTHKWKLARLSKNTGEVLDSVGLYRASTGGGGGGFTAAKGTGVFYTVGDTIFKRDYENLSQKIWNTKIEVGGNDHVRYFNRLVLRENDSALFAFGMADWIENTVAARLDASTGAVQWIYHSPLGDGFSPGVVRFDGGFIYISWQHNYVGGGPFPQIVTKLDAATGTKVWEILTEQVPGNDHPQSALSMSVENGFVYLTGYYDASNYYPGKWNVICLNAANGDLVFRKPIPPVTPLPNEKESGGLASFVLNQRLVVLGNSENESGQTYATWVEMNLATGAILKRSILGSNQGLYDAAVTDMVQLRNGRIIQLRQIGRKCQLVQSDADGNIAWQKDLPLQDWGLRAEHLVQVRGDSIVVAGFGYADDAAFNNFGHDPKKLRLFLVNGATGTVLGSLTRAWSNNYNTISALIRDPQAEQYFMSFQDADKTRIARFNFSSWQGETAPLNYWDARLNGNQSLLIDNNRLYFFTHLGIYYLDLSNWPVAALFYQNDIQVFRDIDPVSPTTTLTCGAYQSGWGQPTLVLYQYGGIPINFKTLDNYPTLQEFSSMVQGESARYFYLLGTGPAQSQLFKFDLQTWQMLWSVPVFDGWDQASNQTATSLVYNPVRKTVSVCGRWSDPNMIPDGQVFVKTFDGGTGQLLLDFLQNYTGNDDRALCALADRNSPNLLVGGDINWQYGFATTGFLHIFDDDYSNSINARVYLDADENGAYDPAIDKPLNIGKLRLDQSSSLYFNELGRVSVFAAPGPHQLEFLAPPGWEITSGASIFSVNTLLPPVDTFFVGLRPVPGATQVKAYLTAGHFVCDKVAELHIFIKNTGPSQLGARLRLAHPGGFVQADLVPTSVLNDSLFWEIPFLFPGDLWQNTLRFQMPGAANLGDSLRFELQSIFPSDLAGQFDTTHFEHRDLLLCAFDPNDKIAAPTGEGPTGRTAQGTALTYTIRFQNTGNFPARNVVVRDTLDVDFDASSFAFVAASHPPSGILRRGRVLEFTFRDIELPPSNANLAASQGFVTFTVAPRLGLADGISVRNTAHIFFGTNPPIATNATLNTYVSDVSVATDLPPGRFHFSVFPNPNAGLFAVELPTPATAQTFLKISDVSGKLLLESQAKIGSDRQTIHAEKLAPGLYFLQIVSEGKLLAVEKFVRE